MMLCKTFRMMFRKTSCETSRAASAAPIPAPPAHP